MIIVVRIRRAKRSHRFVDISFFALLSLQALAGATFNATVPLSNVRIIDQQLPTDGAACE